MHARRRDDLVINAYLLGWSSLLKGTEGRVNMLVRLRLIRYHCINLSLVNVRYVGNIPSAAYCIVYKKETKLFLYTHMQDFSNCICVTTDTDGDRWFMCYVYPFGQSCEDS